MFESLFSIDRVSRGSWHVHYRALISTSFDRFRSGLKLYRNSTYVAFQNFGFILIYDSIAEDQKKGRRRRLSRRGIASLKKKKKSQSKDFLKLYDIIWKDTAPVKYKNPSLWRIYPRREEQ